MGFILNLVAITRNYCATELRATLVGSHLVIYGGRATDELPVHDLWVLDIGMFSSKLFHHIT